MGLTQMFKSLEYIVLTYLALRIKIMSSPKDIDYSSIDLVMTIFSETGLMIGKTNIFFSRM